MKNISTTSDDRLVIHKGIGVANYLEREKGLFELRIGNEKRIFQTLVSAYLAYRVVDEDCSIYDVTERETLVEAKIVIQTN